MIALIAFLLAQTADRVPKTMTDAERLNDNVNARHEYDSSARALLSRSFSEALDHYTPQTGPQLKATWGEFMGSDGLSFIALQLAVPAEISLRNVDTVMLFGRIVDDAGKAISIYNEPAALQTSRTDSFVERSLVIPLQKMTGTFGIARRGEVIAMTRVSFEPEKLTPNGVGVSRLIVSRDVHLLSEAQRPRDPFAFGGTKVVPKPDATFDRNDEVWLFAEVRNPSLGPDGTPHISTKLTIDGPSNMSGPPTPAEATPLKGMPGRYGIGNAIDFVKFKPGDYVVRVVFTDLVSKQSFRREASIHIRD